MIRFTITNITTKLSGDTKTLHLLYKAMRYKHPDAFHIQQRIRYKWDGYVNPLSEKGVMATGLIEHALVILTEELNVEDFEIDDLREHANILEIPTKVGGLTLRPHQRDAIEACLFNEALQQPHPRGVVVDAVNAGKTAIFFGIHLAIENARTIILVNSTPLFNQLRDDLKEVFPDSYGYLQGKKLKWGKIMVMMVQSVKNRLPDYPQEFSQFNTLLVDECDLANNKTFKAVFNGLPQITTRLGFTGTAFLRDLKKDQQRNTELKEIFGALLHTITMKELEDLGYSTKMIVKAVPGATGRTNAVTFKEEWDQQVTFNDKRHRIILRRVEANLKMKRKYIIIFCRYIDQVDETYKFLNKSLLNVTLGYAHHKSDYKDVITAFKEGTLNVLVCSLFLKRGLNLPLIRVVINASGGSFYSNPLQIAGRGVRKHESKNVVFLEDILDGGKYLSTHSNQRLSYYKKQKLTLKILSRGE